MAPLQRLQREHAAVGFYLSAHPLDEYAGVLKRLRVQPWVAFVESVRGGAAAGRLAGTITGLTERRTRTGGRIGIVQVSDPTGQYEAVLFSEMLSQYRELLQPGQSVVMVCAAEDRPEGTSVRIQSVERLDDLATGKARMLVYVRDETPLAGLSKHLVSGGESPVSVVLMLDDDRRQVEVQLPGRFAVNPKVASAIRTLRGVDQVELAEAG